jgi:site-specific DNA recombinase
VPSFREGEMTKRAALYARVSSDDRSKDGRNLEGQLEMGREYAQKHGYTVVAELAEDDRGASGAEIDLPQLNRIREMAANDEIDVLIVREIDRLSRNLAKQLIVEQELRQAGVSIEYVIGEYPQTPEGRLNKHIKAVIAEFEREKIVERMTRGRRNAIKAGNVMVHGQPPYGYRLVEVDGKSKLVTHEPEARIVRLIFQWYVLGDENGRKLSSCVIANRLTEQSVPTWADIWKRPIKRRKWGEWSRSSVLKILTSETYRGRWYYGQRNTRARKNNPPDHWIAVEVPPIVSQEVWEAAQQQRKHNTRHAKRNVKKEYLLRSRARCAASKHAVIGISTTASIGGGRKREYRYYRCNGVTWQEGHVCDLPHFRVDQVDAVVWTWVRSLFENPTVALEGLKEEQAAREQFVRPLREQLAVTDDLLTDNQAKLERVLDLYVSGEFDKNILVDRKTRLEKTIAELQRERVELVTRLEAQTITNERIERIAELISKMGQGLKKAEGDFKKKRQFIEELDLQAEMAVEDEQQVVHIRCVLGRDTLQVTPKTTAGSHT